MSPSHNPALKSGLGSFPFARRYLGNRYYFLFLALLRCFSSRRLPPIKGYQTSGLVGCPIRKSPGLSLLTARRSLSQLVTSFFAVWCIGIRHAPFVLSPITVSLSVCCTLSLTFTDSLYMLFKDHKYSILLDYDYLVENDGFEPTTSALQGRRSSS